MYRVYHQTKIGFLLIPILFIISAGNIQAQFITPVKKEVVPEPTQTPPPAQVTPSAPPAAEVPKETPPPEETTEYISPMKGNLPGEYFKSFQITNKQKKRSKKIKVYGLPIGSEWDLEFDQKRTLFTTRTSIVLLPISGIQ